MSDDKQTITVPVEQETVEILENLEEEWYNTSRKKGQVIDRVVQSYASEEGLESKVDQILSILSVDSGVSTPNTHTSQEQESESEHSEELESLIEEIDAGNPVDPDDWSDDVLEAASGRGSKPFNPDDLVYSLLKHSGGTVEREDVIEAYETAGYNSRTAKQYARDYNNTHSPINTDRFYDDFLEVVKSENTHLKQGYEVHPSASNRESKAMEMFKSDYPTVSAYIGSDISTEGSAYADAEVAAVKLQEDLGLLNAKAGNADGAEWALQWFAQHADLELLDDAAIEGLIERVSEETAELMQSNLGDAQ